MEYCACVDDVIINDQLELREPRPARLDRENEALHLLMQEFSKDSRTFLNAVVDMAAWLCHGDSAGISLEETLPDGEKVLRWVATAGFTAEMRDQVMPRGNSPCGTVLDRNSALLFSRPDRYYRAMEGMAEAWPIEESLLVPWRMGEEKVGTLWVSSHTEGKHFDREDLRLLESLCSFAQAAVVKDQFERERREQGEHDAECRLANQLAHEINNPLQALTNVLELMPACGSEKLMDDAKSELKRISELVSGILSLKSGG